MLGTVNSLEKSRGKRLSPKWKKVEKKTCPQSGKKRKKEEKMEVSTSVLNVEKEKCIQTFYDLEVAGTDYFHIDVMDGEFVKNNTAAKMTEYAEYLKNITNVPLDVHLMVKDVMSFIKSFVVFEPRIITIHLEAANSKEELMKLITFIKENNCKVGVSIKPNTNVEEVYPYLPFIHQVLIMTVEPGEGGQKLIPETIVKIKQLKEYSIKNEEEIDIEADGGINLDNVAEIKEAGCDIVVAGTSIIQSNNYAETIKKMK